jgi:hypothetical protein
MSIFFAIAIMACLDGIALLIYARGRPRIARAAYGVRGFPTMPCGTMVQRS